MVRIARFCCPQQRQPDPVPARQYHEGRRFTDGDPRRSRPNGSHCVGESDSRLLKPLTGIRLSCLPPAYGATSTSPASIRRCPLMIASALEGAGSRMVYAGPSSCSQLVRKREDRPVPAAGYCQRLRSPPFREGARTHRLHPALRCWCPAPPAATRSRPTRAMAASTAGCICASAASNS